MCTVADEAVCTRGKAVLEGVLLIYDCTCAVPHIILLLVELEVTIVPERTYNFSTTAAKDIKRHNRYQKRHNRDQKGCRLGVKPASLCKI